MNLPPRLLVLVSVVLLVAACRTHGGGAAPPGPARGDAPPAALPEDWRGRHEISIARITQRRDGRGGVAMYVQATLSPAGPDVFFDEAPLVRRFVTTDGYELTYPEQRTTALGLHHITSNGVSLGPRSHRGLRDLEVDVRLVHVDEWTLVSAGELTSARGEVALGPFSLSVQESPAGASLTISGEGEVGRRDAPLHWDFRRVASFLDVRDATGRALLPGQASGTSFAAMVSFLPADDDTMSPIIYPLTVGLRIPARYRFEPRIVMFHDIALPALR